MKRAKKLFMKYFTKSFLVVLIVTVVGILTYSIVTNVLGIFSKEKMITIGTEKKESSDMKSKVDEISKNLIFALNEENGQIKHMVVEIFNTKNQTLHYITIPMNTQLSMSEVLYKKMLLVNPSLPQVLKLKTLSNYIPEDSILDYSALLIEDVLGISLSYYTAVTEKLYLDVFQVKEQGSYSYIKAFTNEYKKFGKTLQSETKLRDYINDLYEEITSNLSFSDKMSYLDAYMDVDNQKISFEVIVGTNENTGYYLDKMNATKQLMNYISE